MGGVGAPVVENKQTSIVSNPHLGYAVGDYLCDEDAGGVSAIAAHLFVKLGSDATHVVPTEDGDNEWLGVVADAMGRPGAAPDSGGGIGTGSFGHLGDALAGEFFPEDTVVTVQRGATRIAVLAGGEVAVDGFPAVLGADGMVRAQVAGDLILANTVGKFAMSLDLTGEDPAFVALEVY